MAWYNASWGYRVKVTVLASKVTADLTAFPVYVDLSTLPAGFHTNVKSDGTDIRVTLADETTEVPREVVYYDAAGDKGEIHFKADIDGDTNTDFYIYYGNAAASDYAIDAGYGAENVWDANYIGVWHLDGPGIPLLDSTANDNDITINTKDGGGAGEHEFQKTNYAKVGRSVYAPNDDNCLIVPESASISGVTSITMEGWFYWPSASASPYNMVMGRWLNGVSDGNALWFPSWNSNNFDIRINAATNPAYTFSSVTTPQDAWFQAAVRYDSATHRMSAIKNGAEVVYDSANFAGDLQYYASAFGIGNTTVASGTQSSQDYGFKGYMDEVRYSAIARSDDWMATQYNNQIVPADFFTIGSEEPQPSGTSLKKVSGIATADVKKVSSVAKASIKKLVGIANS